MNINGKPLFWLGSSLDAVCSFSQNAEMQRPKKMRITRSSRNVFTDIGFRAEEAENLKLRADLMIRLSRIIEDRGLTQAQAAALFHITQPRVSNLVRGKIERFSIDTLIAMLGHAGFRVRVVVVSTRRVA